MYLFLGWRLLEDRFGSISHVIESFLWGDSRACHTFLLVLTNENRLIMIEIDVGDNTNNIRKSMKLNITELNEIPKTFIKIEFIGKTESQISLQYIIQSACNYVNNHPNYNFLLNNCRTFVEYLIGQIPDFYNSIPRQNGSILEYYHKKSKHDHPGIIIKYQKFLKIIRRLLVIN